MAMSTATRRALNEAMSWAAIGAVIAGTILYYDDIKTTIQTTLNLPTPPAQTAALQRRNQIYQKRLVARSSADNGPGERIELRAGTFGQFRARVDINGFMTRMLVDTGASSIALTARDARNAGIFPNPGDYTVKIRTANGIGRAAPVVLDSVSIGGITLHDVRALVNEPGTLHVSLLGMSFLSRLRRVDIGSGRMILEQ